MGEVKWSNSSASLGDLLISQLENKSDNLSLQQIQTWNLSSEDLKWWDNLQDSFEFWCEGVILLTICVLGVFGKLYFTVNN